MTAGPVPPLTAAAQQRSHRTRERALTALRDLDQSGSVINFASVARHAQVSRSWLYRQDEIRAEIDRLRQAHHAPTHDRPRPSVEQASPESQHQRIETLLHANKGLRDENNRLRQQVAGLLGEQRSNVATRNESP